jgi:hypothetical protein
LNFYGEKETKTVGENNQEKTGENGAHRSA